MQHYIVFELIMIYQLDMLRYDVDPYEKKRCAYINVQEISEKTQLLLQ